MFDNVRELPRAPAGVQEMAWLGRLPTDSANDADVRRRAERRDAIGFSAVAGITVAARRAPRAPCADPLAPLVARLCQRDESALQALHAAAAAKVLAGVLRIVRREEVADEVVCASFLQAWQTANTFDASRATVITWLHTIARSRAIDALRRHRVQSQHECALPEDGDEDERAGDASQCPRSRLELSQLHRRLADAMFALSPMQRQVLTLTVLGGASHEEVALRTGLPLGTVKSHARRGITALRASPQLRIDAD